MIIEPPVDKLTKGEINRYTLVLATAKCARIVTDEYSRQREEAERMIANKKTDKPLASLIDKEIRDNKAVTCAVRLIDSGEYIIRNAPEIEK